MYIKWLYLHNAKKRELLRVGDQSELQTFSASAFDYSPHPCSGGVTGVVKGEGGGDEECKCS